MRNIFSYLFFTLITIFHLKAQESSYYQPAIGLAGDELKSALHNIIDDHQEFPYTSGSTDVWDILKLTDRDPENSDNVILIYTGKSVNAAQEYNSGNGWTREHVWAKSRGDFGTSQGAGTDVHHLRPLGNSVNSTRNNRALGYCSSCSEVYEDGIATGSYTDTEQWIFEPRDEVKGDVARMLFYMALRYKGDNGEPDLELTEQIQPSGINEPLHGVLADLLVWNEIDPVDSFEVNRNAIIHYSFQGNRNPFIDHPDLAEHLWGELLNETWTGVSVGINHPKPASMVKLYPNPTTGILTSSIRVKYAEVMDQTGRTIARFYENEVLDLSTFQSGFYLIRVQTKNGNTSIHKVVKQ